MTTAAPQDVLLDTFAPAHLGGAVRLSREAGWPHRPEDWALTLSVSTGVVALEAGEVVGTALCSRFGTVATLNMIIVDARMRGRGLGRKLMERAIAAAGGCEMRLVATTEGLPLYEKLGFRASGGIVQHQGVARAAEPECKVETAEKVEALAALDLAASGMDRGALLARIAAVETVLRAEGGFAMLRRFGRGYVLGPVVARDAATARALMAAAATRITGQFLRIDMPTARAQADHAATLGLVAAGEGTSMVRAPREHPDSGYQTYALVSQALG
ncbi:MAG: GNAT family N-acetyltransferase [Rhodobacteraceae bacterium]|nr:GNAT family N-acetyltransferase [Paracoccaceae bacterium]